MKDYIVRPYGHEYAVYLILELYRAKVVHTGTATECLEWMRKRQKEEMEGEISRKYRASK